MDLDQIKYWIEQKCQEPECMNIAERGYVYCINHLHGFPKKLPQEVIDYLKVHKNCEDWNKSS